MGRGGAAAVARAGYTCFSWRNSTNTDASVAVAVAAAAAAEHSFAGSKVQILTQLLLLRSLLQLPPHCVGDTQRLCCPMQGAGLLNRYSCFFFLCKGTCIYWYKCTNTAAVRRRHAAPPLHLSLVLISLAFTGTRVQIGRHASAAPCRASSTGFSVYYSFYLPLLVQKYK